MGLEAISETYHPGVQKLAPTHPTTPISHESKETGDARLGKLSLPRHKLSHHCRQVGEALKGQAIFGNALWLYRDGLIAARMGADFTI